MCLVGTGGQQMSTMKLWRCKGFENALTVPGWNGGTAANVQNETVEMKGL